MSVIREILYNNLKDRVYQDNRYRWFLVRTDNSNQLNHISENDKSNTLISRLMSYYLECIAQDYDDGISEFAKAGMICLLMHKSTCYHNMLMMQMFL